MDASTQGGAGDDGNSSDVFVLAPYDSQNPSLSLAFPQPFR